MRKDLLLKCPNCECSQWFAICAYSIDHIIVACWVCRRHFRSDLKFVVIEE